MSRTGVGVTRDRDGMYRNTALRQMHQIWARFVVWTVQHKGWIWVEVSMCCNWRLEWNIFPPGARCYIFVFACSTSCQFYARVHNASLSCILEFPGHVICKWLNRPRYYTAATTPTLALLCLCSQVYRTLSSCIIYQIVSTGFPHRWVIFGGRSAISACQERSSVSVSMVETSAILGTNCHTYGLWLYEAIRSFSNVKKGSLCCFAGIWS